MLDRSEVLVGPGEPPAEVGRQVPALGEPEDRLQRVRLAQPRVVAAVQELERLDDELDLADPSPPELDVGRLVTLGAHSAVDLRLHRADGRDDARVESRTIDGPAPELPEASAHGRVTGGAPPLSRGRPLPQR